MGHSESQASSPALVSFRGFQVEKVLSEDAFTKTVAVLGRLQDQPDNQTVVLLARRHFDVENLGTLLNEETTLTTSFQNDVYAKYAAQVPTQHSLVNVDVIHPATDKHIQKYTEQPKHMVEETPEMYRECVEPYIRSIPPSRIAWVYNILDKKAEVERLLFEDPDPSLGFMLHPDMKWDQVQASQLYCLVLLHRRDLRSVRDLASQEHLQVLRNVRDKAAKALLERYGVPASDLRMYLHYQPSYYHLHVHITHVRLLSPGAAVGKALLLDQVIGNMETFGLDYYQRATLHYVMGEEDELWGAVCRYRQQQ